MTRFGLAFSLAALVLVLPNGGIPAPLGSRPAAAGSPAASHQQASNQSYQVFFDFRNQDVQGALPDFGSLLELLPLHVDPGIEGIVKIASPNPISREEAFGIFVGILRDHGAVLVRTANPTIVYTVMPKAQVLVPGSETVTALPPVRSGANLSTVPGIESPRREPIRVNEELQASKLIKRIEPVYPDAAARAGITPRGPVRLWVLVNEQGEVAGIKIYGGGHPLLQMPAMEAVKQWRYSPFWANGESAPVIVMVRVAFDGKDTPSGAALPGATPSSAKPPAGEPVRAGTALQASRLIHRIDPDYPEQARRARITVTVFLEVTINERGEVTEARYLRGHPP